MMELLFLRPVKYFFAIVFFLSAKSGWVQPPADSVLLNDSLHQQNRFQPNNTLPGDTTQLIKLPVIKDTIRPKLQYAFTSDSFLYRKRLFFSFTAPVRYTISEKPWQGKDAVFYAIITLLLFFAIVKNSFSRYLRDLYSSYFRTTVRQKQIKEQLQQSPLPSLLFNAFFIVSIGVFLSLVFRHFGLAEQFLFWVLAAWCAAGVLLIYGVKFLLLKLFGWVFQMPEAANTYIFVIFSTNKILGVFVLPFTVLIAFTYGAVNAASVTLSLLLIGLLFLYRYFLAFISLNRPVHIHLFHFLIYFAAFEVLPLLLINKLLFAFLREIS